MKSCNFTLNCKRASRCGLKPRRREQQARIDFGMVELAKDNCRDQRRVNASTIFSRSGAFGEIP
jgi:hypothetical protein